MKLIKIIKNDEKFTDFFISITILLISLSFLLTGISSYLKENLLFFIKYELIPFIPQGLTMLFYGTVGLILSTFQIITLTFNVGEGYNEFNKENNIITIFRKNYPGNNPQIKLIYRIEDIITK